MNDRKVVLGLGINALIAGFLLDCPVIGIKTTDNKKYDDYLPIPLVIKDGDECKYLMEKLIEKGIYEREQLDDCLKFNYVGYLKENGDIVSSMTDDMRENYRRLCGGEDRYINNGVNYIYGLDIRLSGLYHKLYDYLQEKELIIEAEINRILLKMVYNSFDKVYNTINCYKIMDIMKDEYEERNEHLNDIYLYVCRVKDGFNTTHKVVYNCTGNESLWYRMSYYDNMKTKVIESLKKLDPDYMRMSDITYLFAIKEGKVIVDLAEEYKPELFKDKWVNIGRYAKCKKNYTIQTMIGDLMKMMD